MPHSMPKSDQHASIVQRSLVYGLSLLLIWQPMLVAAAEAVSPTHSTNGRPTLDQAANGVPIVNIQNPNGQGVSQNFYNDLNVSSQGLILNNSRQLTQTQLGGYIEGNPNLTNGSASVILNEVIGTNPSSLKGYMEVGGARADVIVANPNGITCNGCGFINTNHATLTTGTAIMEGGRLRGFDVQGGNISIVENGLNASNVDRFDLIARSVEVAGELHADRLNIVTGQQTVNRNTLETSNVTTDADTPAFAIDSTALGGMYANRIRLIANEDGVGVRLNAPVAAQNGNLTLSANGQIEHSDLAATGDITIDANQHDVTGLGNVQSLANITIDAADYNNQGGAVVAERRVVIGADNVTNTGTIGGRERLFITADSILNDESGALLSNEKIVLSADKITNRLADIYSTEDVIIRGKDGGTADSLENRSGRIEALNDLTIDAAETSNVRDFLDWEDVLTGGVATYECIECAHTNYTMLYKFTEQFMRELDPATTDRSLMVAGRNLSLTGQSLLNETSDIIAFNNMVLDLDTIENFGLHSGEYTLVNYYKGDMYYRVHRENVLAGVEVYNTRNYFGQAVYWSDGGTKGLEYMGLEPASSNSSYDPDNFLSRQDNLVHNRVTHIGEDIRILESTDILGANIVAGNDLNMDGADIKNGDIGTRLEPDVSEADLIAVGEGSGSASRYDDYLTGVNGGLFSIADPDHPYLIETNPFFATVNGLLGSEYMLAKLNWDPDGAIRLLGDGYYEQQLIRQQIIDLTGRVLLSDNYKTANQQYRQLLENGVFASESLELAVGVALTPEQINKLTKDIVWLVEQEVAGETVLVPQLYLSPSSIVVEGDGALIAAGGKMTIDDGSILNTGTFYFGGNAYFGLNENGLVNLDGVIKGDGVLRIDSEGEVRNVSGIIEARKVAIKSAQDIINIRYSRMNEMSDGSWREWNTDIGQAGVISGLSKLVLDAEGDIKLAGATLEGGKLKLNADGNIVIDTIAIKEGREGSFHGGQLTESSVQHLGSEVNATLSLLAKAGNDFSLIGSSLNSDKGIKLAAGNDMLIASAANSSSYDFRVRHDGETSHNIQRSVRHQGSEINGGGNIKLSSGNNLTAIASSLKSDKNLSLKAKGDMALLAANDSDYRYSYEEEDGSFGRSRTTEIENSSQRQVGSLVEAGGKLSLKTEAGDIDLVASNGYGAKGVSAKSGGNINILSGVNSEFSRTQVTDTNLARVKTRDTGSINQTLAQAGLTSGSDLSLNAQGDVTLGAAQLESQGDLKIGEATFSKDKNGELRLDENGHPIIERGSIDNLNIGTVTLENESWSVRTRELRGAVGSLAKVGSAMLGFGVLYMPSLALLGEEAEVELSENVEHRVQQSRQVGSSLQAENVQLSVQNDIAVTGSSIGADQENGRIVVLAENILLDTAVTDTTTTQRDVTETASGIDPSLKKDEISLGGLRLTELDQATVIRDITHTGSSVSANQIFLEAEGDISLINADLYATGEDGVLSLTGEEINVTGVQDIRTVSETLTEKTTDLTLSVRNAYVDAAYAVKRIEEAGEAVDDARRALKEAERKVERGELAEEALEDFRIMLAAATANFAQAELAGAQALAAAGAGAAAGGTGFYASGSAQHTETTSTSLSSEKTWQGSSLSASAMSINAGTANIIGSDITAGLLELNATDILIGSGTNEQSSSYKQESQNAGFSVSSSGAGSWNANVGFNEADSESEATQYVNSQLNVGHLASNSESLKVKGGLIVANTAEIETETLHIESLQDTHSSSNSSFGANLGIGGGTDSKGVAQGASAGFNMAEGSGEGARTNQQSAILVADGENSQITARDTSLIGGMIANASYEEDAETGGLTLVDHGNLNFSTETLTVESLHDYSRSEQQGGGLQVSKATTTISLQDTGHQMSGETRATIGAGNVSVSGVNLDDYADYADLNRDIHASQLVTIDQQTGALDTSVTVDNRVAGLNGGWGSISEDHINLKANTKTAIGGAVGDVARVAVTVAGVVEVSQIGNALEKVSGGQKAAYQDGGRLGGDLEGIRDGDVEDAHYAQESLNAADKVINGSESDRVKVTEGVLDVNGNQVAGAANIASGTLYLDLRDDNRNNIVNTLAHEGMHLNGAGEIMSGITGLFTDLTYRANAWANSGEISQHHAVVPVSNYLAQWDLLANNTLDFQSDSYRGELEYRYSNDSEKAFVSRYGVAFAAEYYGVSDRRVSVERLETAKFLLRDATDWLVNSPDRIHGSSPDQRAIDFIMISKSYGRPAGDGQWMFVVNDQQRNDPYLNMPPDSALSMALYDSAMGYRDLMSSGQYPVTYQDLSSNTLGYNAWGTGENTRVLSEVVDGNLETGGKWACYNITCVQHSYMNNPETNRLLEARERRARRDYLTAISFFTGGSGVLIGAAGGTVPASLIYADLGISLAQAGNAYSVGGVDYLLPSLIGFFGGKLSGSAAKSAGFHSIFPPALDFYVPRAIDGAVESIEDRKDG